MHSLSAHGQLGAANEVVSLSHLGMGGCAFQVIGTFTGTITFETSVDGLNFRSLLCTPSNSATQAATATAPGLWFGNATGTTVVRARMSSYSDGYATVTIKAVSSSPASPPGAGGGGGGGTSSEFGAAFPANGTAAGFIDPSGNMAGAEVDADGNLKVAVQGSSSNAAAGPVGDPVPADASSTGYEDPSGDLATLKLEDFDYDTGAGTDPKSAIGIAIPASGGAVPVSTTNPLPISDAGSSITVDGTVTANAGTNLNTSALALEATLSSLNGKVTAVNTGAVVVASGTLTAVTSITNAVTVAQPTAANLNATVIGAGSAGSANAGVVTVQGIASMTPVQVSQATASNLNATVVGNGTFAVQATAVGTVADGSASPGAPVMVGGFMKWPDGTDPGSVTPEDDVVRFIADANRRQYVNTVHPRFGHKHLNGSSAYTDESIVADPGDGFQTIITNIVGSTGAATALNFFLEEGSTIIFGPIYLEAVAGRGFASGPIHVPITASTAVTLTSSANIAQSFDIDYFIQAVP